MKTRAIKTFLIGAMLMVPFTAVQASSVDFTDAIWDEGAFPGPYDSSISNLIDGVVITASAEGPVGTGPKLYQDSTDGLGVRLDYEKDEIEEGEVLTITFSQTIILNSIGVSDLFIEKRGHEYKEFGFYSYPGAANPIQINAVEKTGEGSGNGELLIAGLNLTLDSISFWAPGKCQFYSGESFCDGVSGEDHEFSLQSLSFSPVPIPAAFWMFGTALIGFVAISRRTKV